MKLHHRTSAVHLQRKNTWITRKGVSSPENEERKIAIFCDYCDLFNYQPYYHP